MTIDLNTLSHVLTYMGSSMWSTQQYSPPFHVDFSQRTITVSSTAVGGGDGSDVNPYTLMEALSVAQPGDVVGVMSGIYIGIQRALTDNDKRYTPAFMTTNSGTETDPIHIVAEHYAVFDSINRSELRSGSTISGDGWPAFGNLNRNHVFWWGFYTDENVVDNKPRNDSAPVTIWSSTGGGIRYCDIRGQDVSWTDNHSGIRLENSHGVEVQDCYIYNFLMNGGGSVNQAGVLTYGCSNCDVSYCEIDNCGNNIFWKAGTPQFGMTAHNNILSNSPNSFRIQLLTDTVRNSIYQNLFLNYGFSAIYFSQTAAPNDLPINLVVANNLFGSRTTTNGNLGPFRYDKSAYTTNDNLIRNNIIYNTNSAPVISSEFNTSIETILGFTNHNYNCYFNYGSSFGGSEAGNGTLRSLTQSAWTTTYSQDVNGVFSNPLFTNYNGGDYSLLNGSPCINAGIDVLQLLNGSSTDPINIGPMIGVNDVFGIRQV